jgi:chromate transporter
MLTTWVTFVPCFLWIFLGAPFIERLRNNIALTGAMSAITAAVVGVILNLAVWFGLHTLFGELVSGQFGPFALDIPVLGSLVLPSLLLTLAAGVAIFRFNASVITTLLACALAGMAWTLATN